MTPHPGALVGAFLLVLTGGVACSPAPEGRAVRPPPPPAVAEVVVPGPAVPPDVPATPVPAPPPPSPPPASASQPVPEPVEDGAVVGSLLHVATGQPRSGRVVVTDRGGRTWSAEAGQDGRFRVPGLPRGEKVCLVARSDGAGVLMTPEVDVPYVGDADLGWIGMEAAVDLPVRVVDGDGSPVAGATVTARAPLRGNLCSGPIHIEPWPIAASSTTDATGNATLKGLSSADWALLAVAPGYARRNMLLTSRTPGTPVPIVLEPGHSLEGRVFLAGGAPASGALVVAMESGVLWSDSICCLTVKADAEGRFRMEGLGEGTWPLLVQALPGVLEPGPMVKVPAAAGVDVWLPPRGTVEGRVTGAPGNQPVAAARVSWSVSERGENRFWALVETRTDSSGGFRMQDVPVGTFHGPQAGAAGYLEYPDSLGKPEERFHSLAPGKAIRIDVTLHRGGAVRGVARDRDGAPVPRAWVRVSTSIPGRGPLVSPVAWTADDGSFFVPMAHPGRAYIQARGPGSHNEGSAVGWVEAREEGGIPESSAVTVPLEGEVRKDLVMLPDWVIRGRVILADGTPAVGFAPSLCDSRNGHGFPGATALPTDSNGTFCIYSAEGGAGLVVEAEGPGGLVARSSPFALEEGRNPGDLDLQVPSWAGVSGRVRCGDGQPVRNAVLRLVRVDPNEEADFIWPYQLRGAKRVPVTEDGTFSATGLAAGRYTFSCTADGCSEARGPSIQLAPGATVEGIEVVLPKGWSVGGTVCDSSGEPVVGAEVNARPSGRSFRLGRRDIAAVTGEGGRFRVDGLLEGTYDLRVHPPDGPDSILTADAGTEDLKVVLEPGFAISGRVLEVEAGRPIGGITLCAYEEGSPEMRFFEMRETVSAADGTFTLAGLREGNYEIASGKGPFDHDPLYPGTRIDGVPAGTKDLIVHLERGRCIAGRVTDLEGNPVRSGGLSVDLHFPPTKHGLSSRSQSVNRDGTFLFSSLPSGKYTLEIDSHSFGETRDSTFLPATVEDIAAGTEDLVVKLHRGRPISGRVVKADGGLPFGDMWLTVGYAGKAERPGNGYLNLLDDGSFVTGGLDDGRSYDLSVSSKDGRFWVARDVPAGAVDVEVVPEQREGTISGTVVDEEGKPVPPGLPVKASPRDTTGDPVETETLPGGTFVLEKLGNLKYRVVAGGPGTAFSWSRERPLLMPGGKDAALRVAKGVTLRGVLRDTGGAVLEEDIVLTVLVDGEPETIRIETDKEGKFEIGGLAPGEVTLRIDSYLPEDAEERMLGTFRVPCDPLELTAPAGTGGK